MNNTCVVDGEEPGEVVKYSLLFLRDWEVENDTERGPEHSDCYHLAAKQVALSDALTSPDLEWLRSIDGGDAALEAAFKVDDTSSESSNSSGASEQHGDSVSV